MSQHRPSRQVPLPPGGFPDAMPFPPLLLAQSVDREPTEWSFGATDLFPLSGGERGVGRPVAFPFTDGWHSRPYRRRSASSS